jgi:hypothetical protein
MSWFAIMTSDGPQLLQTQNICSIGAPESNEYAAPRHEATSISCTDGQRYYVDDPVDEVVTFIVDNTRKLLDRALEDYRRVVRNSQREPAEASQ